MRKIWMIWSLVGFFALLMCFVFFVQSYDDLYLSGDIILKQPSFYGEEKIVSQDNSNLFSLQGRTIKKKLDKDFSYQPAYEFPEQGGFYPTENIEYIEFKPYLNSIVGLSISGSTEVYSSLGYARVVAIDDKDNEWLVLGTDFMFIEEGEMNFENFCEETCIFSTSTNIKKLRIEYLDADISIDNLFTKSYSSKKMTKTSEQLKKEQAQTKLPLAQEFVSENKLRWTPVDNGASEKYYYELKYSQYQTDVLRMPYDFFFYSDGIYEINNELGKPFDSSEREILNTGDVEFYFTSNASGTVCTIMWENDGWFLQHYNLPIPEYALLTLYYIPGTQTFRVLCSNEETDEIIDSEFKIKEFNGEYKIFDESHYSYKNKKILVNGVKITTSPTLLLEGTNSFEMFFDPEPSPRMLFPDNFDLRDFHGENWVTTPGYNQGGCAGCWVFSSTYSSEINANLYFNEHINLDLSEKEILSCSPWGYGCEGGFGYHSLEYIKNFGVVNEECFPYSGQDLDCNLKCNSPEYTFKIKSYSSVFVEGENNEVNYKESLIKDGASISTYSPWYHEMALIGWQTDSDGAPIWIFKNPSGQDWPDYQITYIKAGLIGHFDHSAGIYNTRIEYPVTVSNNLSKKVNCVDKDNDGYCNWGLSEEKPAYCYDSCEIKRDCDDSDPSLGPYIDERKDLNCKVLYTNSCGEVNDGGDNPFQSGTVYGYFNGNGYTYTDYCIGPTLTEFYCDDSIRKIKMYSPCPNGTSCVMNSYGGKCQ